MLTWPKHNNFASKLWMHLQIGNRRLEEQGHLEAEKQCWQNESFHNKNKGRKPECSTKLSKKGAYLKKLCPDPILTSYI